MGNEQILNGTVAKENSLINPPLFAVTQKGGLTFAWIK